MKTKRKKKENESQQNGLGQLLLGLLILFVGIVLSDAVRELFYQTIQNDNMAYIAGNIAFWAAVIVAIILIIIRKRKKK